MTQSSAGRQFTLVTILLGVMVFSASDAIAQVRPALTRDVDNPALAPVRILIAGNLAAGIGQLIVDSITVPAGKRLVIENASVWGQTLGTDRITGLWIAPKDKQMFHMLDPNTTEAKPVGIGSTVVAYNRVMKGYFDAGETLQGWFFADGTTGVKLVNLYLEGYYVNVP